MIYLLTLILLFASGASASIYTCTDIVKLYKPLSYLGEGKFEHALEHGFLPGHKSKGLGDRLRLSVQDTAAQSPVAHLKFIVNGSARKFELNTITLTKNHLTQLKKMMTASGTRGRLDPFQAKIMSLNERYQYALDMMSEREITAEERALKALKHLNVDDPQVLREYLLTEDGQDFTARQSKTDSNIIGSQPEFKRSVPAYDDHFALLRQGFQVFAGEEVAFILSGDYQRLGVCPKLPKMAHDKKADALYEFLNDPDVHTVLNCDGLLRSSSDRTN